MIRVFAPLCHQYEFTRVMVETSSVSFYSSMLLMILTPLKKQKQSTMLLCFYLSLS